MDNYQNEINPEIIAEGVNLAYDKAYWRECAFTVKAITVIVSAFAIWFWISGIMEKSELRPFLWLMLTLGVVVLWRVIPLIMSLVTSIIAGIIVAMILWGFSKVIAIAGFCFAVIVVFSSAYNS